jgi:hypothetical protein
VSGSTSTSDLSAAERAAAEEKAARKAAKQKARVYVYVSVHSSRALVPVLAENGICESPVLTVEQEELRARKELADQRVQQLEEELARLKMEMEKEFNREVRAAS